MKSIVALDVIICKLLLPVNGVNFQNKVGETALHLALRAPGSHGKLVNTLLAKEGVEAGIQDSKGITPFMLAQCKGNAENVTDMLTLKSDANLERVDNNGHDAQFYTSLFEKEPEADIIRDALEPAQRQSIDSENPGLFRTKLDLLVD